MSRLPSETEARIRNLEHVVQGELIEARRQKLQLAGIYQDQWTEASVVIDTENGFPIDVYVFGCGFSGISPPYVGAKVPGVRIDVYNVDGSYFSGPYFTDSMGHARIRVPSFELLPSPQPYIILSKPPRYANKTVQIAQNLLAGNAIHILTDTAAGYRCIGTCEPPSPVTLDGSDEWGSFTYTPFMERTITTLVHTVGWNNHFPYPPDVCTSPLVPYGGNWWFIHATACPYGSGANDCADPADIHSGPAVVNYQIFDSGILRITYRFGVSHTPVPGAVYYKDGLIDSSSTSFDPLYGVTRGPCGHDYACTPTGGFPGLSSVTGAMIEFADFFPSVVQCSPLHLEYNCVNQLIFGDTSAHTITFDEP